MSIEQRVEQYSTGCGRLAGSQRVRQGQRHAGALKFTSANAPTPCVSAGGGARFQYILPHLRAHDALESRLRQRHGLGIGLAFQECSEPETGSALDHPLRALDHPLPTLLATGLRGGHATAVLPSSDAWRAASGRCTTRSARRSSCYSLLHYSYSRFALRLPLPLRHALSYAHSTQ